MLVQQPLSFQLHEVHLYIYRNLSQGQYYYGIIQMLMNAMRGQMDVSRNVSTPMGLTTVLVKQATDLFLMVTLALVKDYAEMPFLLHSTQIYTTSDIDECSEESHRCEQNCHNSVGSYACSCDSGYHLNEDGLTCNGRLWHHHDN